MEFGLGLLDEHDVAIVCARVITCLVESTASWKEQGRKSGMVTSIFLLLL